MSQLSFVTDLSDAYEEVRSKAKSGKQTIKALIEYFEARSNAEDAFVKALSKLPTPTDTFMEQTTVLSAWKSIYDTTNVLIKGHSSYVNVLKTDVIPPLKQILEDLRETKKKLEAMEKESTKKKIEYENTLAKARAAALKSSSQAAAAVQMIEELNNSGTEITDKYNKQISETAEKAIESEELAKQVEITYKEYQELYKKTISDIMNTFEESEIRRITTIKDVLSKQAIAQKESDEASLSSSTQTQDFSTGIDAKHDVAELIFAIRDIVQTKMMKKKEEHEAKMATPAPLPPVPAKPSLFQKVLPMNRPAPAKSLPPPPPARPAKHLPPPPPPKVDPIFENAFTRTKDPLYQQLYMPLNISPFWTFSYDNKELNTITYAYISENSHASEEMKVFIQKQLELPDEDCQLLESVFNSTNKDQDQESILHYISLVKSLSPSLFPSKNFYDTLRKTMFIYILSSLLWKLKQSDMPLNEKQALYKNSIYPLFINIQSMIESEQEQEKEEEEDINKKVPEESNINTSEPVTEEKKEEEIAEDKKEEEKKEEVIVEDKKEEEIVEDKKEEEKEEEDTIPVVIDSESKPHSKYDGLFNQLLEINSKLGASFSYPSTYYIYTQLLEYRYRQENGVILISQEEGIKELYTEIKCQLMLSEVETTILELKSILNLYLNNKKTKEVADIIMSYYSRLTALLTETETANDIMLMSKISYQLVTPLKNNFKDLINMYSGQSEFIPLDLDILRNTLLLQQLCNNHEDHSDPLNDDLVRTLLEGGAMMYFMTISSLYTYPHGYPDIINMIDYIHNHTLENSEEMKILNQFSTVFPEAKNIFINLLLQHLESDIQTTLDAEDYKPTEYIQIVNRLNTLSVPANDSIINYCNQKLTDYVDIQFNRIKDITEFTNDTTFSPIEEDNVSLGAKSLLSVLESIFTSLQPAYQDQKLDETHTEIYLKKIISVLSLYIETIEKNLPVYTSLLPALPVPIPLQQAQPVTSSILNFMKKRRPSMTASNNPPPLPPKHKDLPAIPATNGETGLAVKDDLKEIKGYIYRLNSAIYIHDHCEDLLTKYSSFCDSTEKANLLVLNYTDMLTAPLSSLAESVLRLVTLTITYKQNKDTLLDWVYSDNAKNSFQIALETVIPVLSSAYSLIPDDYKDAFKLNLFKVIKTIYIRCLLNSGKFLAKGLSIWEYRIKGKEDWTALSPENSELLNRGYAEDQKMLSFTLENQVVAVSLYDYIIKGTKDDTTYEIRKSYSSIYYRDYLYIQQKFFDSESSLYIDNNELLTEFNSEIQPLLNYMHLSTPELLKGFRSSSDEKTKKNVRCILLERNDILVKQAIQNKLL
ncbi:hypothetical protein WA158_006484 [Blastocystis sp. Blastoise]